MVFLKDNYNKDYKMKTEAVKRLLFKQKEIRLVCRVVGMYYGHKIHTVNTLLKNEQKCIIEYNSKSGIF